MDINNSLVKDGAVTQAPAAYFQQCIASKLDALFTSVPGLSIFLIPSPRDIIHNHFAFPQSAFDKEQLGLSRVRQPLFLCYPISDISPAALRIYTFFLIPVFSPSME